MKVKWMDEVILVQIVADAACGGAGNGRCYVCDIHF